MLDNTVKRLLYLCLAMAATAQLSCYVLIPLINPSGDPTIHDYAHSVCNLPSDWNGLRQKHMWLSMGLILIGIVSWIAARHKCQIHRPSVPDGPKLDKTFRLIGAALEPLPMVLVNVAFAAGLVTIELVQPEWNVIVWSPSPEKIAELAHQSGVYFSADSTRVVRVTRGVMNSSFYRDLSSIGYREAGGMSRRASVQENARQEQASIAALICIAALVGGGAFMHKRVSGRSSAAIGSSRSDMDYVQIAGMICVRCGEKIMAQALGQVCLKCGEIVHCSCSDTECPHSKGL
jgi:hypothetical protein